MKTIQFVYWCPGSNLESSTTNQPPSGISGGDLAKVSTTKVKERGSWFGQTSNLQKPNHEEVTKPRDEEDSEKLAKIEMHNTTNSRPTTKDTSESEENGNVIAMKGRRFFIGATESQRGKSNGEIELKANTEEGPTEVTRLKSNRTRGEAEKMDEDEADTQVDMKEDQHYKEETEE
ncbi:hypothetical protein L1987_72667 [Smallanthus sonchifolius]|uniref:Uncharacterized protein n=1 Tax=Smallanthus sonchifolius TaxID=185202 RepID=A0ACB9AV97_9ASTR|nr:hypothetical protein L1987_72667 [Smallanthus sonchifolius]